MTNFDAAKTSSRRSRSFVPVAIIALAVTLAGCESSGSIFGGLSSGPAVATPEPAKPAAQAPLARIAMAPVMGAPDAVSRQIAEQIVQAGERQRIGLVNDRDAKVDYTLRGYVVASKDRAQTKVTYIWDLTDPAGKRVNRITGNEMVPAGSAKDPWVAVTAAVTQTIADKTATSLATWLAANRPAGAPPAGGAPIASPQPPPSDTGSARPTATATPAVAAPLAPVAEPAAARTQTASLPTSDVTAIVPAVNGAPGDGNTALSSALQRELSRQGITLANRPGTSYRIEGKVALGPPAEGKQSIQIDWLVRDPQGRSLGTVSQKNDVAEGSLDSSWGDTADAAAGAATQGILKLLPQPRAVN